MSTVHLCPCCKKYDTDTSICACCAAELTDKGLYKPAPDGTWNPTIHGKPPIEALIRWRDAATDRYGEDAVSLMYSLRHDDFPSLPDHLNDALLEFRAMDEGTSYRLVNRVLEGDTSLVVYVMEEPMPIGNLHIEISQRFQEMGIDGRTPVRFELRNEQTCVVIDNLVKS